MVEKDIVFSGKIKHFGIFDYKEFYNFTYKWLTDEGYWVTENTYTEKVNPKGKEVEIEWTALKKISDYFRFRLDIHWRILGMTSVEVEENGVKLKLNKGQPEISVKATLEKDYEGRWENNNFMKFLRGLYEKFIIRGRIEEYEDKIFSEADEFLAQVKAFLALEGKR